MSAPPLPHAAPDAGPARPTAPDTASAGDHAFAAAAAALRQAVAHPVFTPHERDACEAWLSAEPRPSVRAVSMKVARLTAIMTARQERNVEDARARAVRTGDGGESA